MSLSQFLRILWARRFVILALTLSCVLGACLVVLIAPARWEAHARVLLNLSRPDPLTGEILGGSGLDTYIALQQQLVEDYSVANLVIERLGWPLDPKLTLKYQKRSSSDHQDFRHWLAQPLLEHTSANLVEGSNILEITYTGAVPEDARHIVGVIRQAYLDTNLSLRRAGATRAADWFASQAAKEKSSLDAAEKAESDFERANNVYMATDTADLDSARLAALATQSGTNPARDQDASSTVQIQLADIEAEIAQLSRTLGPNHPQLQALRTKKASLQAILQRQSKNTQQGTSLARQAADISANYEQLSRLRQLHGEVDLHRDLYAKTLARAVELRQQAAVSDFGVMPLGAAFVSPTPTFPKTPLIVFGSLGLGGILAIMVSLLIEFLNRRIRGLEDLELAVAAPVLAVVKAESGSIRT